MKNIKKDKKLHNINNCNLKFKKIYKVFYMKNLRINQIMLSFIFRI